MNPNVHIYDTTLRDGTQREGISLSLADKLRITRLLDEMGVSYIEGGWPGSNPKDAAYFEAVQSLELRHSKIAAFGSTCRKGSKPADDENIKALVDAYTPVVTVVGKTSMLHVVDVLQATPEENLRMIRESLAYLKSLGKEVIYDAEHFFDGAKLNMEYAFDTIKAAVEGGADVVCLCDTNGGSMPWEVTDYLNKVRQFFPYIPLGIHTHNDSELAVANSLAAVKAGAVQVQGTINGYGERCGNANLCSIIPDLILKMDVRCLPEHGLLKHLTSLSYTVAEIANLAHDNHLAYVGRSAFANKGSTRVIAMQSNIASNQHIDPMLVGNEMHMLIGKLEEPNLDAINPETVKTFKDVKYFENYDFASENAEASIAIRSHRAKPKYMPIFELIDFTVITQHRKGRGHIAEAMVKLDVFGEVIHTAAEGNGPVNALDIALRKALMPHYPEIAKFQLVDYKIHILNNKSTTAITQVLINTLMDDRRWLTIGACTDIIRASWLALVDSIEYGLCVTAQKMEDENKQENMLSNRKYERHLGQTLTK